MNITRIALARLRAHPLNSNVMREELLEKLVDHIAASGRYPPLIVRELDGESTAEAPSPQPSPGGRGDRTYQVLDGHHRWAALRRAGHEAADCVVWDVDEAGALTLLSTLNRLQGQDDPRKRSRLLDELRTKLGREAGELSKLLPESAEQLRQYLALRQPPPRPAPARPLEQMPVAVTFFLTGAQKQALDAKLDEAGGPREAALLKLTGVEP